MHGPNAHPTLDDDLGWDELADVRRRLLHGRRRAHRRRRAPGAGARGDGAAPRERGRERREVDVLIGSAYDRNEQLRRRRPPGATAPVRLDRGRCGRPLARRRRQRRDAGRPVPPPGPVVDTYGAGDVFMAALTLALGRGRRARRRARGSRARGGGAAHAPRGRADLIRHLYVHVPVLRAPLRLLRLRDRDGPRRPARALRRAPCSRSWTQERARLAPQLETVFVGGGTPTLLGARAARPAARRPARGAGGDGRGQPRDGRRRARRDARGARHPRLARRAVLRARAARRARAPRDARAGARGRRAAARGGRREPLARPALRRARHGSRRARPRHRRGARARSRASLLLRARGQARHALHAPPRRRARAPGRAARGPLRARDRPPRGGGLPLVRDRQLLPRRPPRAAQPGLLDGARLPRHRHRRGVDARRSSGARTARRSRATSTRSSAARRRPGRSSS